MPIVVGGKNNPQKNEKTQEGTDQVIGNVANQVEFQAAPGQVIENIANQVEVNVADNSPHPAASPTVAIGGNAVATPKIHNTTVPVVVFMGPPSSGKSMILVRLAKFLRNEGYTIDTDNTFLATEDYQRACKQFRDKLCTNIALDGSVEFLLVTVKDKSGREVAKLLEAPGEDFYTTDPEKIQNGKNMRVEPYLATIMTSTNPKSYVMLLDLDSEISFRINEVHKNMYAQRFLDYFLPAINLRRDRIVLLYNKIDSTAFGSINNCHNPKGAREDAEIYYRQIFTRLRGGLFNLEQFAFKTFCTGMFAKQTDNLGNEYKTYNIADDIYPRELWKEITKKW